MSANTTFMMPSPKKGKDTGWCQLNFSRLFTIQVFITQRISPIPATTSFFKIEGTLKLEPRDMIAFAFAMKVPRATIEPEKTHAHNV